jgi:hypothetical protein
MYPCRIERVVFHSFQMIGTEACAIEDSLDTRKVFGNVPDIIIHGLPYFHTCFQYLVI